MKLKPYTEELRYMREVLGRTKFREDQLVAVLDHVGGDWDLAVTALLLRPRPKWLKELLFGLGKT